MFQPLVSLKRQVILSNDTESVWESTCPNTEQFIKIENAMYKYFLICSWLYAVRPLPLTFTCMVSFGDSKHEPVKPLQSLLNVTPFKLALSAKCTIHDVVSCAISI